MCVRMTHVLSLKAAARTPQPGGSRKAMLRRTLGTRALALYRREAARYVAPALASTHPATRCDCQGRCICPGGGSLPPSPPRRARAYRAGSATLLTHTTSPSLDRPATCPTEEELLDEEMQAEEEMGLGMTSSPAHLRCAKRDTPRLDRGACQYELSRLLPKLLPN